MFMSKEEFDKSFAETEKRINATIAELKREIAESEKQFDSQINELRKVRHQIDDTNNVNSWAQESARRAANQAHHDAMNNHQQMMDLHNFMMNI